MSLLRGKGKGKRNKEENELMESTLGMLHDPPTTNDHNIASNTLPSKWQPGRQLQPPRSPGRPLQQSPPPHNVRAPGQSPYRNGSANRPRPGYNNSLSSNSSLPRPGGLSPTSPSRFSPGMPPGSPVSLSSNDSRRYRTWSPAAPMGTHAAPATLSADVPRNVSPNLFSAPRPTVGAPVTRNVSPNLYSAPRPPPGAPVPIPDFIDGRRPNPMGKPLMKPDKPEKVDKAKVRKPFQPPEKTIPTKYSKMQNFHSKESYYQRHKCLVISLIILFILLLLIAIILFTVGYFYNFFRPMGTLVPALNDNCTYTCDNNSTYPNSALIVIALDGFRYDYLETFQNSLPNINTLADCGVEGQMLASFPATTSPNLRTMVTGYYPQSHGILSERMNDPGANKNFDPRVNPNGENNKDAFWFPDPSLWEIARKQGKVTASQQWLGDMIGEVDDPHILGKNINRSPTYVDSYDRSRNYTSRLQIVVDWMRLPINERPELTTIYFEDPGLTAREHGAESVEVIDKLEAIDSAIGYLRRELIKINALGCVNIMIVSTSGLEDVSCDRVYYLTSDFQESEINHWERSAEYLASMSAIGPKDNAPVEFNTPAKIAEHLTCEVNNGRTYLKDLLPNRLHGSYSDRLNDVVVLMNEGWSFAGLRSGHNAEYCRGADDGYDPFLENMKGVFIGSGRDFKLDKTVKSFQNVELFNLMSDLIGLEPLYKSKPSDGSIGMLYDALRTTPKLQEETWKLARSDEQMCQFPSQRREETAGCTCTPEEMNDFAGTERITFVIMDENLNIQDVRETTRFNTPLGIPGVRDDVNPNGEYYCVLYQDNFITTYDRFLKIPTSVSFTLESSNRKNGAVKTGTCIRYDQRLDPEVTAKCSEFSFGLDKYQNITLQNLYKPSLAPGANTVFDSQITSNIVPQFREFAAKIWDRFYEYEIWNWVDSSDQVNTVVGPAYDMNRDSRKDSYYQLAESLIWVGNTPLPTHYFGVVTRCHINGTIASSLLGCHPEDIQFIAWIFPHVNDVPKCFNFGTYFRKNLATLRDVEQLTGLVFFPELSMSNNDETRLKMIQLKTLYPYDAAWTGLS